MSKDSRGYRTGYDRGAYKRYKPTKKYFKRYRKYMYNEGWMYSGEKKYYDTSLEQQPMLQLSNTSAAWASALKDPSVGGQESALVSLPQCLNSPNLGDRYYQREGRKIAISNLKFRIIVRQPSDDVNIFSDDAESYRIIIFVDTKPNANTVTGDQVIRGIGNYSNAINFWQLVDNFGRFRVLYDKTFRFPAAPIAVSGTNIYQGGMVNTHKINLKFKRPLVTSFNNGDQGKVADVMDNALHIMAGRGLNSTEPSLSIEYYCRCVFRG